jgi:hypothetical protein
MNRFERMTDDDLARTLEAAIPPLDVAELNRATAARIRSLSLALELCEHASPELTSEASAFMHLTAAAPYPSSGSSRISRPQPRRSHPQESLKVIMSERYMHVIDPRPEVGNGRIVATHDNIGTERTPSELLKFFGINDHLKVAVYTPTPRGVIEEIIQAGRTHSA